MLPIIKPEATFYNFLEQDVYKIYVITVSYRSWFSILAVNITVQHV